MKLPVVLALYLFTLLPPVNGIQSQDVQDGQKHEHTSFLTVRPDSRVRLLLCPDSVVLFLAQPGLKPQELELSARALARVLHRPVIAFASSADAETARGTRDMEKVSVWIQTRVREGKHVDVVSYGRAGLLAVNALEDTKSPKGQIRLYSIGQRVGSLSPRIPTWTILGQQVLDGGKERSEPTETEEVTLGAYLARIQGNVYGDTLDALLFPKEKKRHPRPFHRFEFRIVAEETYRGSRHHVLRVPFDLEEEKRRLDRWLSKARNQERVNRNPRAIQLFNRLTAEQGGPKSWYLDWYPSHRVETEAWKRNPGAAKRAGEARWHYTKLGGSHRHFVPMNMHETFFSEEDMRKGRLEYVRDLVGRPALRYEMSPLRKQPYAEFTDRNRNRHAAILLFGSVRIAPQIMGRIAGGGQITGAFKESEIKKLIQECKDAGLRGQLEDK